MTRGPPPWKIFPEAADIAGRRGTVKWFDQLDSGCSVFSIFGVDIISLVSIHRLRKIWSRPEEISRDFFDTISRMKVEVLTRSVVPEIWFCSYHGTWRFFQITGWDLAELDRDGRPVDIPSIGPSGKRTGTG